MRSFALGLLSVPLAAIAAPAIAQDAPTSPFTVTGGATLTSDYRFRGLSHTDKRFAVQGTLGIAHASGFYAGVWGSSIDDYVENGADQEIDFYGGYRRTLSGTTVDAGLLYYYYPGSGGVNSDFFEPYINASHTFGPVGVKVGGNFAWNQHGLGVPNTMGAGDRRSGAYVYGEASAAIPGTGFTVTGHLGHSFVRNYVTFADHYSDWSVTAAYSWKALTISAAYVDTNRDIDSYPAGGGRDRDISKGGFVGAVAVSF